MVLKDIGELSQEGPEVLVADSLLIRKTTLYQKQDAKPFVFGIIEPDSAQGVPIPRLETCSVYIGGAQYLSSEVSTMMAPKGGVQ